MEIRYKNNVEDIVALSENLLANDTRLIKRKRWALYGCPFILLLSFSLLAVIKTAPEYYAGAVLGSIFLYFWVFYLYKNHSKKVAHIARKKVFKEHTITLSSDGINEKTEDSTSYNKWLSIHRISITAEYVFVYNTPVTAHIISKHEIGDNTFNAFIKTMNEYVNT